jgi:hypothetical protein
LFCDFEKGRVGGFFALDERGVGFEGYGVGLTVFDY